VLPHDLFNASEKAHQLTVEKVVPVLCGSRGSLYSAADSAFEEEHGGRDEYWLGRPIRRSVRAQ
jgi:hypothetical protein